MGRYYNNNTASAKNTYLKTITLYLLVLILITGIKPRQAKREYCDVERARQAKFFINSSGVLATPDLTFLTKHNNCLEQAGTVAPVGHIR
jgi:hypothetical protein